MQRDSGVWALATSEPLTEMAPWLGRVNETSCSLGEANGTALVDDNGCGGGETRDSERNGEVRPQHERVQQPLQTVSS